MTYKQLKDKLRAMIWPFPNEPKSLRDSTDFYFLSGMAEMQQWDECLRQNHTSVYPFCSTYVTCGMSLFALPASFPSCDIKRIYTIIADSWCDKVILDPTFFEQLETWIHNLLFNWTPPTNVNLPALQKGVKVASASMDCSLGRARKGYWCIHNMQLWVAPWINSNEAIVVEWDGWKEQWSDADIIDETIWGVHEQATLLAYVKWMSKLNYPEQSGIATPVADLEREWNNRLADLMHFCEKAKAERPERKRERRLPTQRELDAGKPSATVADVFYGSVTQGFGGSASSSSTSSSSSASSVAATGNAIPVMTANDAPSGLAFASGSVPVETGPNAYTIFDHNLAYPSGQLISNPNEATLLPGYHGYKFDEAKYITAYRLYPLSGVVAGVAKTFAAPKSWELQGSLDGTTYATIDSQSAITGWTPGTAKTYSIAAPGSYQYYRLWVTEADGTVDNPQLAFQASTGTWVTLPGLAEFELLYSL